MFRKHKINKNKNTCDEIHYNSVELFRLFKKYVGVSPKQYITNYRMTKAKNLLEDGLPVTDVSNRCGFSDIYYFSKAYKKHFGYPPSQTPIKSK